MSTTRALFLAIAVLGLSSARADSGPDLLEEAVSAYTLGLNTEARDERLEEFRRAERLFAQIVHNGVASPDLYTNLGNSALQAEHLGNAVLAYRRALRLDPDHPRALQNLEHARSLLPEWVPRPEAGGVLDTFFFWHRTLSRSERSIAAAVSFALAALLLALAIRFGQTPLRNLALLPGLGWVVLVASVLLDPEARAEDQAIITADEVVARVADSNVAPSPFPAPLPGGAEVRILEERSPWVRIRLANGRDAWVNRSSVARVADKG